MKKLFVTGYCFFFLLLVSQAQQKSLTERLGYAKDMKLLIIHADDLGVAQSVNAATINAMEKGSVSSGSIMVPCPWLGDIAAYARAHPAADLGLHLTLTSEWKNYKWGTVVPATEVHSLLNKPGFLFSSLDSLYSHARLAEVEKEIRAQIERAKMFGIDPTHFDAHMGCLYADTGYLQIIIRLGREYKLPVMLNRPIFKAAFNIDIDRYISEKEVLLDNIFMAQPNDFSNGMDKFYTGVLQTLPAGVSLVILHAGYDNPELQAVTIDHPDYGAAWRQADFNFFTSAACKELLRRHNIKVITWKEIRDKLFRN